MQAGAGRFQLASGPSSMRKTRFLKLGGGEDCYSHTCDGHLHL